MEITYLNTETPVTSEGTELTATDDDVLYPYKYIGKDGVISQGKMPNNGSVSIILNAGQQYTIPKGYHVGNGIVFASKLENQTVGSATADKVVEGKTVWVNGEQLTGTLELRPSIISPVSIKYGSPYLYISILPGAYLNTLHTISIDAKSVGTTLGIDTSYIADGQKVYGYTGTYTSDATALDSHVKAGKTYYSHGEKRIGTLTVPSLF